MKKGDLRILFMGTPEFAVESLKMLVENGYNVVGVVTMPDKPAGRGYKLKSSPIKQYALEKGLKILQPEKLKSESFLQELKDLRADLQVVVAFRMLPEVVWSMPPKGTFNLHSSLLPQYRGAAPINWAIINGENETGVTTFKLVHEIDSGSIAYQTKIKIGDKDDAGVIHDSLMKVGAKLVLKTVDAVIDGSITLQKQDTENETLKPAPKIFKETCKIDWNSKAEEIDSFIRGLSPYPTAHTTLERDGEAINIKVFKATPIIEEHTLSVGAIAQPHPSQLDIAVSNGFIRIKELQVQGRKRMKSVDFLNGFKIQKTDVFK